MRKCLLVNPAFSAELIRDFLFSDWGLQFWDIWQLLLDCKPGIAPFKQTECSVKLLQRSICNAAFLPCIAHLAHLHPCTVSWKPESAFTTNERCLWSFVARCSRVTAIRKGKGKPGLDGMAGVPVVQTLCFEHLSDWQESGTGQS